MSKIIKADLCVIGGGSGGLSVAAGASQMGADTVLIEGGKMGGDCLNYGCVPSKALLAAAKKANGLQHADEFGVTGQPLVADYEKVMGHVSEIIAGIAPHDSVERFEQLGVRVIEGYASFSGPDRVTVDDVTIKARRFVIATGSRATAPPISGLETCGYMTNETLFENREKPEHLIIIGGGPIGMEMAQAHRRLGSRVTVLEAFKALAKDDPDLTSVALKALRAEGIDIREDVKIHSVDRTEEGAINVVVEEEGREEKLTGSHLLVAAGRKPNLEKLNLEAAGVEHSKSGIEVDERLRSSNRKIFAIGDVAGGFQFTHVAGYHAGIVIRNALFRLPAKVNYDGLPWVTYTDPEIANVGMTEKQAREQLGDKVQVLTFPYAENDRARAERKTEGFVKAIIGTNGKILGAGIVGMQAGELIQPWALAITGGLKVSSMASYIAPYPTLGEINKRAAGSFYTPKLFSSKTRWIVKLLSLFG
ncbi:dihydrolipoyl dehydrogenase family protein [Sneathiella aquimaris]|uniref:dihydrolipoyl dehydrogenase family protein n=1 Tax=Sneathiella aquimaris TaxID=2599305 RepID=UPI00146D5EED|nr:FAD-dependent oxidoreductase [Sneathiella aquimaris]